jgi:hypothetical protein
MHIITKRKTGATVLLLFTLLIWSGGCAHQVDNFIGVTEIRNDNRVKFYNAYLFESAVPGSRIPYSAIIVQTHRNAHYFLINQNISEDPEKPIWKVVRQLKVPRIDKDHAYVGRHCSRNGVQDGKILALVLSEKNEELLKKVEKAWVVNTESVIVESISPEGIVCENPYYGTE